jgi:hypothetical protein
MDTVLAPSEPRSPGVVPHRPDQPHRPSRAGYAVGALITVAGLVAGIVWGVSSYTAYLDRIEQFPRIDVPGSGSVQLAAGEYVLYYEGRGGPPVDLSIAVSRDGVEVETGVYVGDLRYDAPDGLVGQATRTFRARSAGHYTIDVNGAVGRRAALAVGEGLPTATIATVLAALLVIALSLGGGLVVLIVTGVRRARATSRER